MVKVKHRVAKAARQQNKQRLHEASTPQEGKINELPEDVLQKILRLAAPDHRSRQIARLVCQLWGRTVLGFVHSMAATSCDELKSATSKLPELRSLIVSGQLSLSKCGADLALFSKLTSLYLCRTQAVEKVLTGAAGSQLASRLRRLELHITHPFRLVRLARLSSLESLVLWEEKQHLRMLYNLRALAGLPRLAMLRLDPWGTASVLGLGTLTGLRELWLATVGQQPPNGLSRLQGLHRLFFKGHIEDPSVLAGLTRLESLTIEWDEQESADDRLALPLDFGRLSRLTELDMRNCHASGSPLALGPNLARLRLYECSFHGLEKLDVGRLAPRLESLTLSHIEVAILCLRGAGRLRDLRMDTCQLQVEGMERLSRLESLGLVYFDQSMTALLDLEHAALPGLTGIKLFGSYGLRSTPSLGGLQGLVFLDVGFCEELAALPGLGSLAKLRRLRLADLRWSAVRQELAQLTGLESLWLIKVHKMRSLAVLDDLTRLTQLHLVPTNRIKRPALRGMTGLRELRLDDNCSLAGYAAELAGRLPELRCFYWTQGWAGLDTASLREFVLGMPHLTQLTLGLRRGDVYQDMEAAAEDLLVALQAAGTGWRLHTEVAAWDAEYKDEYDDPYENLTCQLDDPEEDEHILVCFNTPCVPQ